MLLLNPKHSILIDVKTNRNGFRSSGQHILAWRVQIPEVEPFDGFQFHVNSGILGSVDVSWLSSVDPYSEDLGSYSKLPRLEVFTLEFHFFSCFLQFDYSIMHYRNSKFTRNR